VWTAAAEHLIDMCDSDDYFSEEEDLDCSLADRLSSKDSLKTVSLYQA